MNKIIIVALTMLTLGATQAEYTLKIPLEQNQGGSLPTNSIKFNTTESEEDDVSYVPFSGAFGYSASFSGILLGQKSPLPDLITAGSVPVTPENPEVVEYALYVSKKIILDNFNVADTTAGAEFSEVNLVYQNCLPDGGNYICRIRISVGNELAACERGIYSCYFHVGSEPNITFNGRYIN